MKNIIATLTLSSLLSAAALAQTGNFDFSHAPANTVDTFTSNGISLTVTGLINPTWLNQNNSVSTVSNSQLLKIGVGEDGGIGTGPDSDNELRNNAGYPALTGLSTMLEISNIKTPAGTVATGLNLKLASVDAGEGYLVYGSAGDASNGQSTTLSLLSHGQAISNDFGEFNVSKAQLSQFKTFYVTADNAAPSSVLLGSGTTVTTMAVPEPATLVGLGIGAIAMLRRRKKA